MLNWHYNFKARDLCLEIINNDASRALIHQYENLKRIIYNCNANIYFNQRCLHNNIIPNFAKIKIPNISPSSKFTQHKASITRIKNKIKYIDIKKQQLNKQLLYLRLNLAFHGITHDYIQNTIEEN